MKEGFQEETRHLWPRAAGTKEEGAQEAGLSSYLPSSGLAPGGCGSDENTEMLASWALTCQSVGGQTAARGRLTSDLTGG